MTAASNVTRSGRNPLGVLLPLYAISLIGIGINLAYLFMPPESGNGITTLPLVIFLLLALSASTLAGFDGTFGRWGRALLRVRRHLGINAGLWALTHGVTKAGLSLAVQPESLWVHLFAPPFIPALGALLILTLLLLTSNDRAVRTLGASWKSLHSLVWMILGIALVHGYYASLDYTVEMAMNLPVVVPLVALVLLAAAKIAKGNRRPISLVLAGAALAMACQWLMAPGPEVFIRQE